MSFRPRFPQWNYGYAMGPMRPMGPMGGFPMGGAGDYSMMFANPSFGGMPGPRGPRFRGGVAGFMPRPGFLPLGRGQMRGGRGRGGRGGNARGGGSGQSSSGGDGQDEQGGNEATEGNGEPKDVIKAEGGEDAGEGDSSAQLADSEEGEVPGDRPLVEILGNRNPIMFCNEQSKYRDLRMEWEQVSETGPPHDKTFTWSLKMGEDLVTFGSANSKKLAKSKAAEEMALKLDKLPRNKRTYQQMMQGGAGYNQMPPPPPWMMRGRGMVMRGRGRGRGMWSGRGRGGPGAGNASDAFQQQISESGGSQAPAAELPQPKLPKLINEAQNNPISKLYEHSKRNKQPEPIFEIVSEEVIDQKRTSQGYMLKKTEFTMKCSLQGRNFFGTGMTKKAAKHSAAAAAWAEIGVGVKQKSIDSFLQQHKNA